MDEEKICGTCRYYNSNIPCGTTPSACKKADKFAEEFVDELKKLKPTAKPCKDDLIRRSDAIKAVTSSADYVADAVERLERIPAVEPNAEAEHAYYVGWTNGEEAEASRHKPRCGEWIFLSVGCSKCSECEALGRPNDNFCPHCGAKMKGVGSEGHDI